MERKLGPTTAHYTKHNQAETTKTIEHPLKKNNRAQIRMLSRKEQRRNLLNKVEELINPVTGQWDIQLLQQTFWEDDFQLIRCLPVHVERMGLRHS